MKTLSHLRISDLGILFKQQAKLNKMTWRSKQNTYHVVNKNIAPFKVTDERRWKRGCLPGHPQALTFWCPWIILGVPWASPSLGSFHSLFYNPSKEFTQNLKTSQHKTQNRKLVSSVSERKQKTTSRYCNELILYLYLC